MTPRFFEEMSWRMGEVYAAVTDQILINLARHFKYFTENNLPPGGAWQYQIQKLAEMGQVTQETEQIILNMLGDADGALRGVLDAAIRDGLKDAEKPLRKAAEKGLTMYVPPEVAPNQMNAFRAYYRQSADKLNMVNTVMLDSTQKAYQATVSDIVTRMSATQDILNVATGEVVSGVSSMNAAVRQGVKKMVSNGITGFIDHGGHHWSPEAYVTMDIRTTMANTARAAVFERQEDYGSDLYQVSWHDGARPLCYPWQGKVISRSDWSGEVEDGDGNKVHVYAQSETSYGEAAGLFGINCGHFPNPFFPGMSYIRPPEQNKEENDKEYELSQQQRALERNLRNEKRELEVMKAQGAPEDEIKAQRQRVKNARTEIDDFCDQTGRARRRSRESAPINATFPDGYKQTYYERGVIRRNPIQPEPKVVTGTNVVQETKKSTAELVTQTLPNSGITANALTKWAETPTEQKIISSLGGQDQTKGSCSSLAFAYAGNRAGYDVHDFRGGDSCSFFARNGNIEAVAKLDGVGGLIIKNTNEVAASHELFKNVEAGKEYYFATGRHAAVVRQQSGLIEYLELQGNSKLNGWHLLNDMELRYRFGAKRSNSTYGMKLEPPSFLIDIDKLKESPDFLEMLKYINTPVGQQKKGVGGGIK